MNEIAELVLSVAKYGIPKVDALTSRYVRFAHRRLRLTVAEFAKIQAARSLATSATKITEIENQISSLRALEKLSQITGWKSDFLLLHGSRIKLGQCPFGLIFSRQFDSLFLR